MRCASERCRTNDIEGGNVMQWTEDIILIWWRFEEGCTISLEWNGGMDVETSPITERLNSRWIQNTPLLNAFKSCSFIATNWNSNKLGFDEYSKVVQKCNVEWWRDAWSERSDQCISAEAIPTLWFAYSSSTTLLHLLCYAEPNQSNSYFCRENLKYLRCS